MEVFSISGMFALILLVSGIVLTVITIHRMIRGQIVLPGWAKWLLSAAMIGMLLITILCMLPPLDIDVDNPLIETDINIVTPADPSETTTQE